MDKKRNVPERVRRIRIASSLILLCIFCCLGVVFEQIVIDRDSPPPPAPVRPAASSAAPDLSSQLTDLQTRLDSMREERDAVVLQLDKLRKDFQEEHEINNRLRDDLTKATARLRQASGKGRD